MNLVGLALGISAATGCIIPQDYLELEPVPPLRNRRPFIVSANSPTKPSWETFNGENCSLTFDVTVDDPDVDQHLWVYFYLDYEESRGEFNLVKPVRLRATRVGTREPAKWTITPRDPGQTLYETSRAHVVDAIVTDDPDGLSEKRDPASSSTETPYYTDSTSWFITVKPGDCPEAPEVGP